MKDISPHNFIWLSHQLSHSTPYYGGGGGDLITPMKKIECGDSCNAFKLAMPIHHGTHVDCPAHFILGGKCINDYQCSDWFFSSVSIVECIASENQILSPSDFDWSDVKKDCDLLLIKTHFEERRDSEAYWKNNPGVHPDFGKFIENNYKTIKAIGIDVISVNSFQNREIGRTAHREILSRGIRIIEDMTLKDLHGPNVLLDVICIPLVISGIDAAPVTIIGKLYEN